VDRAAVVGWSLERTATNLRRITADIERGRGTAGAVIESRRLYDRTMGLVEQARTAVGKLEERVDR
jgi:hypothetical protein